MRWLSWYWQQTGGNVLAMPACGAVAVLFAVAFRRPLAAWWRRHFGARADLAEIREIAASAHRIAADLYRHHTGTVHSHAPKEDR